MLIRWWSRQEEATRPRLSQTGDSRRPSSVADTSLYIRAVLGTVWHDWRGVGRKESRFRQMVSFIAVVTREPGDKRGLISTVYIHDVQSGLELASVVHGRAEGGRRQFLEAGCTVAFTSDGKYIVTSGITTKVWRLGA